ncbi:MAG TPA: heparan-alpha-glucosaminide N-acetyltransferase domain-containing protein [Pseudaminobacter sp.]|nr:heparan-alpha-glucosaminide N-acetyltransferase domain-containing protein [Pseudaminobacter sp.]
MAKNAAIADARDGAAVDRLVGIDLARGLAVFGMCVVHVGGDIPDVGGLVGNLMELAHGRSSALFAVLAGFSIILITGRKAPKSGEPGRQAIERVAIRALVLLALGSILTCLGTTVQVILESYGICFLLVLPLYRLCALQLGLLAAGTALVLPQVCFLLLLLGPESSTIDPVFQFMVSGTYPAMTWVPFVIAGMAIARLDLSTQAMHWRLGLAGGALAVLGYGGSWLALRLLPGVPAALQESAWWWSDVGYLSSLEPLIAAPHSETTFSILGNTGCAMIVLAARSLWMRCRTCESWSGQ